MTQDERNRDEAEVPPEAGPTVSGENDAAADPANDAEPAHPVDGVFRDDPAAQGTPGTDEREPEPASPVHPVTSGGGGSMIIGGVLAAAIGAGAALAFLPEGWRRGDTAVLTERIVALESRAPGISAADLSSALNSLESRLTTIEQRLAAVEERAEPDLTPITDRLNALESRPDGLSEQDMNAAIGTLSQRIDRIEAGLDAQARAAVETALADARAQIDARAQALSAREETVAEAQERIAARAALAELVAAAESGVPVPGALVTLTDFVGDTPALAPMAEGLPSLARLQEAFASAARAALAADTPEPDAPLGDRLVNFLRSQTGARSLAPRDGDGTDAVLSRAEAALRAGNLPGTLAELDALTGEPAQAMANWRFEAETRLAAVAALDEMETRLNGNED